MLGFRNLTWAPLSRVLIDTGLLSSEERAWVDADHAEVLEKIGPLVDAEVADWLKDQCKPI